MFAQGFSLKTQLSDQQTKLLSSSPAEDAGRWGFSFGFKERGAQKHTQSVKQHCGRRAADREGCFQKHLKNKGFIFLSLHLCIRKIFLWKNKRFFHFFAFWSSFSIKITFAAVLWDQLRLPRCFCRMMVSSCLARRPLCFCKNALK